jgi:hypothetical protein
MLKAKERIAETKRAIADTANRTKVVLSNVQLKDRTMNAMVNFKEITVDAKNAVLERTKDMKLRYQEFKGNGELKAAPHEESTTTLDGASQTIEGTRIFGVPAELACERAANYCPTMPDVVFKCLMYLQEKAAMEEGIFRLSGSITTIQHMKALFDQGVDVGFDECYDPHVISGLLKLYLRELPYPLIALHTPPDTYDDLKQEIENLPAAQRCILGNLMRLLQNISKNEASTKMGTHNLVIIFVPTLNCSSNLVYTLISYADDLFSCEPFLTAEKCS